MNPRVYNKLYASSNREEGSEKILLGYQHDGKEITLKANEMSYFHVPLYTETVRLSDSSLIASGATPGPFPAASDRIFKSKKNYGNVTADGNPTETANGVWFCSWLYKNPEGEVQWLDRYYKPGTYNTYLLNQNLYISSYTPYNPIFQDLPSTFAFEPGVLYNYYHYGEEDAQTTVTTFGGISGERLVLDLKNWGQENLDESQTQARVVIDSNAPTTELYPTPDDFDRITDSIISFDNNHDINVSLSYSDKYAKTEEFTWSAFCKSPDWNRTQTTQLFGNFTSQGGVGAFIETLSSFPFFVIPETRYGHILYVNEGLRGFLDLPVNSGLKTNPGLVAIDSDKKIFVCQKDNKGIIYKLDNFGKILASSKESLSSFAFVDLTEQPIEILCGVDQVFVRTDKRMYTFDSGLNLLTTTLSNSALSSSVGAFKYDTSLDSWELIITDNVNDCKFIETTQWCLSSTDGHLYKKLATDETPQLFYPFGSPATKLAVDPYNRLWVLHGSNSLSILDSNAEPFEDTLLTTNIGTDVDHQSKNISFFCQYNRSTQSREWKAIVYYSSDRNVYVLDMEGRILETINLLALFNTTNISLLNQNSDLFEFLGHGDFTGYERHRVFKNLTPYKNQTQFVLRMSLRDKTKPDLTFETFKTQFSINEWDNDSWQHIVLTLKNKTFTVYINDVKKAEFTYPSKYELSYELQPQFSIGCSNGSQTNFNQEIQYTSSIFNGTIENIKIYDYAIDPSNLELFLRAKVVANDIYWDLPVPDIQYIEKIERLFKNKIPGAKTPFYRIKIKGMKIEDEQTRFIIEEQIKEMAQAIQPAYSDFLEVHWVD